MSKMFNCLICQMMKPTTKQLCKTCIVLTKYDVATLQSAINHLNKPWQKPNEIWHLNKTGHFRIIRVDSDFK